MPPSPHQQQVSRAQQQARCPEGCGRSKWRVTCRIRSLSFWKVGLAPLDAECCRTRAVIAALTADMPQPEGSGGCDVNARHGKTLCRWAVGGSCLVPAHHRLCVGTAVPFGDESWWRRMAVHSVGLAVCEGGASGEYAELLSTQIASMRASLACWCS
ncbi:hypothetical protein K437DRAFT_188816 [Tilletiaria anomala UBC 951]|uniref:Uncharacterized protein n=1 Tax=Tilletiaria anomala (strain ATCC 24038 / CBS 436.72 / UBC 951) TaxID=1037660 RepID=A0A066VFL9_TILAU|nr:uncharacterized protein K437DRAFT_188816 [Tilletiaria anomala UBC 951]KDN40537.1 hypothetical protein K437DRAFT_188816 [Tilletiaria anomala UBC 951]